jgi:hypothetical protein
LDFASEFGFEFFRVKQGNGARTAASFQQALPEGRRCVSHWRQGANARYYNPF